MNIFKRLITVGIVTAGSWLTAEPVLSFSLNEGDLSKVKEDNGKVRVNIWNPQQFSWQDGPDGQALSFDTPDKLRSYAGLWFYMPAQFDPAAGFTFSAYVKTPKKLHRSRQYKLFHWSNNHGAGPGFRIYISWKMLYIMFGDGKKRTAVSSKNSHGPLQDDTWYHLAASYDGKTARVYINGVLRGQKDGPLVRSGKKWAAIGASGQAGAAYGFNGIISKVKIYDHALSDAEIAAMQPEK